MERAAEIAAIGEDQHELFARRVIAQPRAKSAVSNERAKCRTDVRSGAAQQSRGPHALKHFDIEPEAGGVHKRHVVDKANVYGARGALCNSRNHCGGIMHWCAQRLRKIVSGAGAEDREWSVAVAFDKPARCVTDRTVSTNDSQHCCAGDCGRARDACFVAGSARVMPFDGAE